MKELQKMGLKIWRIDELKRKLKNEQQMNKKNYEQSSLNADWNRLERQLLISFFFLTTINNRKASEVSTDSHFIFSPFNFVPLSHWWNVRRGWKILKMITTQGKQIETNKYSFNRSIFFSVFKLCRGFLSVNCHWFFFFQSPPSPSL